MIDLLIQGAATPLAIIGFFAAAWAVTFWRSWVWGKRITPPRRDGRIPVRERELLGDDWRDQVRGPVR